MAMQTSLSARSSGSMLTASSLCNAAVVRTIRRPTRSVHGRAVKESMQVKVADPGSELTLATQSDKPKTGRALISAKKSGVQPVTELQKSLAEYMSLPASQYSVLDARRIERISDDMFKCYVGELRMFSWSAEPVLTVSVTVEPEAGGCTIQLLSCELKGSKFVEDINDKFSAQMTNVVRWRVAAPKEEENGQAVAAGSNGSSSSSVKGSSSSSSSSSSSVKGREIVSTTSLRVELEIPKWCSFLSVSSVESVGSNVLQGVLNAMVPRFLLQLETDYTKWASGDSSRQPVGDI